MDKPFWRHAANNSGGTPRMAARDRPHKVLNATIRASLRRRNGLPVGWKAQGTWLSHRLFPRFTERLSAYIIHKYQIENAPSASPTSGAALKHVEAGRGDDDGVRERIREERRQQRAQK